MKLRYFVSEALIEIAEGVKDAQCRTSGMNPHTRHIYTKSQAGGSNLILGLDHDYNPIHMVDFDVAVTSSEGTETKGGIAVVSGFILLSSQGKSQENTQSISRIKFKVPVCLPASES